MQSRFCLTLLLMLLPNLTHAQTAAAMPAYACEPVYGLCLGQTLGQAEKHLSGIPAAKSHDTSAETRGTLLSFNVNWQGPAALELWFAPKGQNGRLIWMTLETTEATQRPDAALSGLIARYGPPTAKSPPGSDADGKSMAWGAPLDKNDPTMLGGGAIAAPTLLALAQYSDGPALEGLASNIHLISLVFENPGETDRLGLPDADDEGD